jgi:hypothetical protein
MVEYAEDEFSYSDDDFYTAWSSGSDVNLDPSLLLGSNSGITNGVAADLWDDTNNYSFMNSNGASLWFDTATNSSKLSVLADEFGITTTQASIVATWFIAFKTNVVPGQIEANYGVDSLDQLAYRQWGMGDVLDGASIADIAGLPADPEFALWDPPYTFNTSFSEWLLSNPETGLFNGENILTMLGILQGPDPEAGLASMFHLGVAEAGLLANYFNAMVLELVDPMIIGLFPNSGPFIIGEPKALLWSQQDPLLAMIGQDPSVGLLHTTSMWGTKATAEFKNMTIFRGGNKDDLLYFLTQHEYFGLANLDRWKKLIPVSGYTGAGLVPGTANSLDSWTFWIEGFARAVLMTKDGTMDVFGIKLDKYSLDPSNLEGSAVNPDNDVYYQSIGGFFNMSVYNPVDLFISRPNWAGADADIKANVTGLNETEYDYTFFMGIEPLSGLTMEAGNVVGINFYYVNIGRLYVGLDGWGIIPVIWTDTEGGIDEADAHTFKSAIAAANLATVVALAFGIVVGLLCTLGGCITCFAWYRRSRATYVKPVEE